MTDHLLKPHSAKKGYFVENDSGEPISKTSHIFSFTFREFDCSDTYSVHKPITFRTNENGQRETEIGEPKERETTDLRIEMIPKGSTRYSYIGTRELIEKYTLVVLDLDDHMCEHPFPHLKIFPYHDRESPEPTSFCVFLYLDKSRVNNIRKRIVKNELNVGELSFTIPNECDVVFTSEFKFDRLSEDYLERYELDLVKHKYLSCSYPRKILPQNFYDYDRNLLSPYDDTPIQEFDLTFGKKVLKHNLGNEMKDDLLVKAAVDEYLTHWMWRDPDACSND